MIEIFLIYFFIEHLVFRSPSVLAQCSAVAIETFGPWAPMGLKLIKEVGKKIGDLTGEKRSTSYLLQSISIAIQRGNAASVMGTVYNDRKLEEIYNL